MAFLIEAEALTKQYSTVIALDGVDFRIGEDVTGLLGPNGAAPSWAFAFGSPTRVALYPLPCPNNLLK